MEDLPVLDDRNSSLIGETPQQFGPAVLILGIEYPVQPILLDLQGGGDDSNRGQLEL